MILPEKVALVVLASGMSQRFGAANKLLHPLEGRPLAAHAASRFGAISFVRHIAVVAKDAPDVAALFQHHGFAIVPNVEPQAGQSHSICLGVGAALDAESQAIMIALADMPFIDVSHVEALLERWGMDTPIVASARADGRLMPPALFGAQHFDALQTLHGDKGARDLLRQATAVEAPAPMLADFDLASDFENQA